MSTEKKLKEISKDDIYLHVCELTGEGILDVLVMCNDLYVGESDKGFQFVFDFALALGYDYADTEEAYNDEFYYYTTYYPWEFSTKDIDCFYDEESTLYDKIEGTENQYINLETQEIYLLVD